MTASDKSPTSPRRLKMSLLENAYDSLNVSLESADLADDEDRAWKLAVLTLVHALELFLKERLSREHRLLVYSDVDSPRHTVSLSTALLRLQAVGVAIEPSDDRTIRLAIRWRDEITHFEFELLVPALRKNYAQLFEFLHSFHETELGGELHLHIRSDLWWKEAELIEFFKKEFITYQGVDVHRGHPIDVLQAQEWTQIDLEGASYPRIAFHAETMWPEAERFVNCPDCAVLAGQFHTFACDWEQCPRCGHQLLSCGCEIDVDEDEEETTAS